MTSTTAAAPQTAARPASLREAYGFELLKMASLWRLRLVLAACWLGPALIVVVVSRQSTLPTDTIFGRWMGTTGWAGSLVALSFCSLWVLPMLTALVAGDVFAAEDRLGTWRHLLVAVRSPRRLFAAKALASLTVLLVLMGGLALSSVAGGLASRGNLTLVGLDGSLLAPSRAAVVVLLAWATLVAPTLAFAAVGLLGSVAFGRSPTGLLLPALLAFAMQAAQLLPLPVALRLSLPSYGFLGWRGLFTDPVQTTPLAVGLAVSVAWSVTACALAYRLFLRRDFTDLAYDGAGRSLLVHAALPLVALLLVSTAVVTVATPSTGRGIDRARLESALSTSFGHLYRLQSRQLGRPDVTERELSPAASCDKGGSLVEDRGAGHDWRCVVSWRIPGATVIGSAIYQLDVAADGRYVADGDGPATVNGSFLVRTAAGPAPNPLWQFDGLVDLLPPR